MSPSRVPIRGRLDADQLELVVAALVPFPPLVLTSAFTAQVSCHCYGLPSGAARAVGTPACELRASGVRVIESLPRMAHVAAAALGDDEKLVTLIGRKGPAAGGTMELNTLLVQLPLWGVPEHARVARLFKARAE